MSINITFTEWLNNNFGLQQEQIDLSRLRNEGISASEYIKHVNYARTLFDDPSVLIHAYSPEQIERGLFSMGKESGCLRLLLEPLVPGDLRRQLVISMFNLYDKLFRFNSYGQSCFMWWELVMAYGPLSDHNTIQSDLRIRETVLITLSSILHIPVVHCTISALHGLGHMHRYAKMEVKEIIDTFMASSSKLDDQIAGYALRCRYGVVM